MEITLGEIATAVALFAGLITGSGVIIGQIKKLFLPLRMDICINYIVSYMQDLEAGQTMDEVAKKRFHEQYDFYINHDGNSYIKEKYQSLKERGLL